VKVAELQKALKKRHGAKYVTSVEDLAQVVRLPTGIYPFDYQTGGGFPKGKMSIIWGSESTGKTNMALKAIAMNQLLNPDEVNVFLDIEGGFDVQWATLMGVDVHADNFYINKPDYAEQAVDILQTVMKAEDVGIVVLDSIGAMVTTNEEQSTAEKASVGGTAKVVTRMINKMIPALAQSARNEHYPSLLVINQMRAKIGVMFGSPDTMNGGKALAHASALTVRMTGKDIIEPSINKERPAFKFMTATVVKFKVPVLAKKSEFSFPVINQGGLRVGVVDDWKTLASQMKDRGWLYKEGKTVHCFDEKYSTYKAVEKYFKENRELMIGLRAKLVEESMADLYKVGD
jgi:recombination protein RecA